MLTNKEFATEYPTFWVIVDEVRQVVESGADVQEYYDALAQKHPSLQNMIRPLLLINDEYTNWITHVLAEPEPEEGTQPTV